MSETAAAAAGAGLDTVVRLSGVIVAVTDGAPRVLTLRPEPRSEPRSRKRPAEGGGTDLGGGLVSLPYGPLDPAGDPTLELALRRWVAEQTGLSLGYVEQLYTFGDRDREPAGRRGQRVISIAYVALVREDLSRAAEGAGWKALWSDVYRFFPWEDRRGAAQDLTAMAIEPALERWAEAAPNAETRRARRERADIAFGLRGAPWDGERVLARYELLYGAGLVDEAGRDRRAREALQEGSVEPVSAATGRPSAAEPDGTGVPLGESMVFDHRRILATALGRLRGKIRYRPVVFELLPPTFTLFQLQQVVEALAGVELHKGNFRRLVEKGGLVEGTGRMDSRTGGRPAELFRFRREVLRERPAPGVGLPGVRQ